MITYTIKVANLPIGITNIYGECKAFCVDFLTDERPVFYISTSQEDIELERPIYEAVNGKCGNDGIIETFVVYRKISECIVDRGAFMLHGAAIAVNGYAYIFTGHSGVGKSTHIKKWLCRLSNAIEINGDKPYIITGNVPMVCGSPWAGKERLYTNTIYPLKAIILLNRAEENKMDKVPLISLYPELCQQVILSDNTDRTKKTLQMLGSLGSKALFYRFHINNFKDDCFDIAYHTLVGEKA